MRIAILNNMQPFVRGGAEELADHLGAQLELRGHEVELVRIPLRAHPPELLPAQILLAQNLELDGADRVIALKFPAYLVRHPRTTVWLLHQLRQTYDLFDAGASNIPATPTGHYLRSLVRAADNEALSAAERVFTNSSVTKKRLAKYNGIRSSVLLPPLNDETAYRDGGDGGYVFAGGRVNAAKRQTLLIEAMQRVEHGRLVIAGPPDSAADADQLRDLVADLGVGDRVHLDLRFLPREEYAAYLNESSAVAYLPYDEDSLGYVTMEAAAAGKPVITTADSGGVLQLVANGQTGWVAKPDATSLSAALDAAFADQSRRAELGAAMSRKWQALDVTWDATISRLLS